MERILELIKKGEKRNVELKRAYNKLPSNLFESICAFLNRNGGTIILGVEGAPVRCLIYSWVENQHGNP